MKIKRFEIALALGLAGAIAISCVTNLTSFAAQCDGIRGRVLRLHILANSDSVADQALKLRVRDKILASSPELFGVAANKQQAEEHIEDKLPEIQKIAQDEVTREGYKYAVGAKLVNMYFTTRTYGDVTLPAGYYDALRITIGSAKGHNWWCVMFPPLCLPTAQGEKTLNEALNGGQQKIVKGYQKPNIKVKFKIVEWYESLKKWAERK